MAHTTDSIKSAAIVGMADSNHYLVGLMDADKNLTGLSSKFAVTVNSLTEAKQYLKAHHFSSALLEYQTAYDEMCGLGIENSISQRINL